MAFACFEAHFPHAVTPLLYRSFRAASSILFHPDSREPPRSRDRSPRIFSWALVPLPGVWSVERMPLFTLSGRSATPHYCFRVRPRLKDLCHGRFEVAVEREL